MPAWWVRVLALCLGGALGANARYWLHVMIQRALGERYPWGTFAINVSGSLLIGVFAGWLAHHHPHSVTRMLVIVGFLGSYTTFSSYALEGVTLWRRGEAGASAGYLAGSVVAGVVAVLVGLWLSGGLGRGSGAR